MSQDVATQVVRILKIGNCPTLSGKGQLGYHIGLEGESDILFRMTSNSGGGYFNSDWVSLKAMQAALTQAPKPVTSFSLSALFKGRSVNTQSFIFSALKQEGLVATDPENVRTYVVVSSDLFMSEMTTLIDAGTDLKVPVKVTGKGVVKSSGKAVVVTPPSPPKGRPKKAKT